MDTFLNPDSTSDGAINSAISVGATVIAGLGGVKLIRLLAKKIKIKQLKAGKGSVTILNKANPKEIDAAKFLAEKEGVGIAVRGKNIQGADFIIGDKLWELKTLESATDSAVFNNIRKAIKKGQSTRIVIDGRNVGLTKKILLSGIARAQRNGKNPS